MKQTDRIRLANQAQAFAALKRENKDITDHEAAWQANSIVAMSTPYESVVRDCTWLSPDDLKALTRLMPARSNGPENMKVIAEQNYAIVAAKHDEMIFCNARHEHVRLSMPSGRVFTTK